MTRKTKIILCVILGAIVALVLSLLLNEALKTRADGKPIETDPPESFTVSGDRHMTYEGDLSKEAYPAGTSAGDWLASCESADRNDYFDAYILCHTATAGDQTVYTYLIYYRHGDSGYTATPTLLEGDDGNRRIDLSYVSGSGKEDYALSRLSVTLPVGKEPRVRLLVDGDSVGGILTVTETPIP